MSELASEFSDLYSDTKKHVMTISDRIKKIRAHLGYSQKKMAEALGITTRTWQVWEEGGNSPGGKHVESLVLLGFNANWLFTGSGSMLLGEAAPVQQQQPPQQPWSAEGVEQSPYAAFDSLGVVEGMGMLTSIYGSGDTIYIRAINANLMAFSDAIIIKKTNKDMQLEINTLKNRIAELEQKFEKLLETRQQQASKAA
jgi:DNA-binding transcriptional regulator YiaG